MNSQTIFVVEDDSVLREVLVARLSKSGYAVEGAEDGSVALQKLHSGFRPDLMLLDIFMPNKNGMEVMEDMSQDPELKNIPIVIISNSDQPIEIERARMLGAKDFLVKAVFDPSKVLEKVRALLAETTEAEKKSEVQRSENHINLDSNKIAVQEANKNVEDNKGKGVLVVEDDKFLRDLFVHKLLSVGLKVEYAVDAKGAFEVLGRWKPNIILLDLILPDVDGFHILARIKKDERLLQIPVVILSNLGQQEDIDRAMSLGAEGYMVKASFNLEEIAEHVQEILRKTK